MKRTLRRSLAIAVSAALIFGNSPVGAFASFGSVPVPPATSSTNPGDGEDGWWRQGWGRSLYPEFQLALPSVDGSSPAEIVLGTLYRVDNIPSDHVMSPPSDPEGGSDTYPQDPENYYRSARPDGANLTQRLDLAGIAQSISLTHPIDGRWYYHYKFFSNHSMQPTEQVIGFGMDVTNPASVTGLEIGRTPTDVWPASTWMPTSRIHAHWNVPTASFDYLGKATYDNAGGAGIGYYQVLVDDVPLIPRAQADLGRVYELGPGVPSGITVEDPPPGRHKLSIVCVDRATNEGLPADRWYQSDPDTPTIRIDLPAGGGPTSNSVIQAYASDGGGVDFVTFALDSPGATIATDTSAPYSVTLGSLAPGPHILYATVQDMYGRRVTTSTSVDTTDPGRQPNRSDTMIADDRRPWWLHARCFSSSGSRNSRRT